MKFDPSIMNPGDWIGWPCFTAPNPMTPTSPIGDGWNYFKVGEIKGGETHLLNIRGGYRSCNWISFEKLREIGYDFAPVELYEHYGEHALLARRIAQGRVRNFETRELTVSMVDKAA